MAGRPLNVWLRLAVFTLLVLVVGGLLAVVFRGFADRSVLEALGWATLFALMGGWLVFLLEPLYRLRGYAVAAPLAAMMLRLGCVAGGALFVLKFQPGVPRGPFVVCLAAQYLVGLLLETWSQLKSASQHSLSEVDKVV